MVLLSGRVIVSPKVLLLLVFVVMLGYGIVYIVVNRKWGYTPKREKELEEKQDSISTERARQNRRK